MTVIDTETRAALEELRDAGTHRLHIAATGAAAGLQGILWSVPGCSALFGGASFPYAQAETDALLGFSPGQYASRSTAVDLAIAAFMKVASSASTRAPVGVGIAASVTSLEDHRGDHRVHVAVFGEGIARVSTMVLRKGGDDARRRDGEACDLFALGEIMAALAVPMSYESHPAARVRAAASTFGLADPIEAQALFAERLMANPLVLACGQRRPVTDITSLGPYSLLLHPGTFDPPHEGHITGSRAAFDVFVAESASRRPSTVRRLVHTITIDPPNKPKLTTAIALRRALALGKQGCDTLLSAGDPLFVDKAQRFPNACFVVGADTVIRMLDPQWGPSPEDVMDALMRAGACLYVIGREVTNVQGKTDFVTLKHPWIQTKIPDGYGFIFRHVPGRWDVSSSAIRAAKSQ